MADHGFRRHRLFLDLPAIVIGNHCDCPQSDLRFAGQFRLRQIRHPDHVEALATIELRFRARGKRRPVHVHIRTAVMDPGAGLRRGRAQDRAHLVADRFPERNMRGDPFAEESVMRALARAVVKLRGQQHIARRVFLLQASDCGDANDPADIERAQRVNVRPVI